MGAEDAEAATTIVNVEEQMRGWLSAVARLREARRQVAGYERLWNLIAFLSDWPIVQFGPAAAEQFDLLRKQKVRIGAQDLKVASVALVNDALLLSANLRDFRQVPGLRVESWLE